MPSLPVLALLVILPLLLMMAATPLVRRVFCNHIPCYGRRQQDISAIVGDRLRKGHTSNSQSLA